MMDLILFLEVSQAALVGITFTGLVYLFCHRKMYSLRDFGIVGAIFVSLLSRYVMELPPVSHVGGITLLNLIFLAVLIMVWSRPSRIPLIDRYNECGWKRWACKLFGGECT